MRLANLKEFRRLIYTPDSAPALNTLRANIEKIPGGQKRHGRYYVDLDTFDRETNLSRELTAKRERLSKSPVLEGLL